MDIQKLIIENSEYFEDLVTRLTHHTNAIEGSTLTMAQTHALIFGNNNIKVQATPREFYETVNHKQALDFVLKYAREQLSEDMIKSVAKIINKDINNIVGYRAIGVFIRGAEHVPPPASEVRERMMYFVSNYNNAKTDNIFEFIASKHIEFERIHPFEDGNGRTGRLLITKEFIKNDIPPAVIKKEMKAEYLELLQNRDSKGLAKKLEELSSEEASRIKTFIDINKNSKATKTVVLTKCKEEDEQER